MSSNDTTVITVRESIETEVDKDYPVLEVKRSHIVKTYAFAHDFSEDGRFASYAYNTHLGDLTICTDKNTPKDLADILTYLYRNEDSITVQLSPELSALDRKIDEVAEVAEAAREERAANHKSGVDKAREALAENRSRFFDRSNKVVVGDSFNGYGAYDLYWMAPHSDGSKTWHVNSIALVTLAQGPVGERRIQYIFPTESITVDLEAARDRESLRFALVRHDWEAEVSVVFSEDPRVMDLFRPAAPQIDYKLANEVGESINRRLAEANEAEEALPKSGVVGSFNGSIRLDSGLEIYGDDITIDGLHPLEFASSFVGDTTLMVNLVKVTYIEPGTFSDRKTIHVNAWSISSVKEGY